jgi:hypothetical protein
MSALILYYSIVYGIVLHQPLIRHARLENKNPPKRVAHETKTFFIIILFNLFVRRPRSCALVYYKRVYIYVAGTGVV